MYIYVYIYMYIYIYIYIYVYIYVYIYIYINGGFSMEKPSFDMWCFEKNEREPRGKKILLTILHPPWYIKTKPQGKDRRSDKPDLKLIVRPNCR